MVLWFFVCYVNLVLKVRSKSYYFAGASRVYVGAYIMDQEPRRFEWVDGGIQWKGKLSSIYECDQLHNFLHIYATT